VKHKTTTKLSEKSAYCWAATQSYHMRATGKHKIMEKHLSADHKKHGVKKIGNACEARQLTHATRKRRQPLRGLLCALCFRHGASFPKSRGGRGVGSGVWGIGTRTWENSILRTNVVGWRGQQTKRHERIFPAWCRCYCYAARKWLKECRTRGPRLCGGAGER